MPSVARLLGSLIRVYLCFSYDQFNLLYPSCYLPAITGKSSCGLSLKLSSLLGYLVTALGKLIVVGDFNIHVDDVKCNFRKYFLSLTGSFDLFQHVSEPTHVGGHILDLVLSRPADNVLVDCFVSDLITDHHAIHWYVRVHRPLRPTKLVFFRKLNDIDYDTFLADVICLSLVVSPAVNCHDPILEYNSGLADVLIYMRRLCVEPSLCVLTIPGITKRSIRREEKLEDVSDEPIELG